MENYAACCIGDLLYMRAEMANKLDDIRFDIKVLFSSLSLPHAVKVWQIAVCNSDICSSLVMYNM